jgi:hypothetical protein
LILRIDFIVVDAVVATLLTLKDWFSDDLAFWLKAGFRDCLKKSIEKAGANLMLFMLIRQGMYVGERKDGRKEKFKKECKAETSLSLSMLFVRKEVRWPVGIYSK